jgi:hypothetical protein
MSGLAADALSADRAPLVRAFNPTHGTAARACRPCVAVVGAAHEQADAGAHPRSAVRRDTWAASAPDASRRRQGPADHTPFSIILVTPGFRPCSNNLAERAGLAHWAIVTK